MPHVRRWIADSWNVFATGWKTVVAFGPEAEAIPILMARLRPWRSPRRRHCSHHAFVRATDIASTIHWQVDGVSLWGPRMPWGDPPDGPPLRCLPDKIWVWGLGHLEQAFAWT